jgi:hypothetical protein
MMRLTLLVCLALLLVGCSHQPVAVEKKYPNGQVSERYSLNTDSLKTGPYISYFPNGKPFEELVYEQGRLLTVLRIRDSSGRVLDSACLRDGTGYYPHYTPDGRLTARTHYAVGQPHGLLEVLRADGEKVQLNLRYRNGALVADEHPLYRAEIQTAAVDSSGNTRLPDGPQSPGFTVATPNQTMALLVQQAHAALYGTAAPEFRQAYKEKDLVTYLDFAHRMLGDLKRYRISSCQPLPAQGGRSVAQVSYQTEHTHTTASTVLEYVKDAAGKFRLSQISFQPAEGSVLPATRDVARTELRLLMEQKPGLLYDRAGPAMKQMPRAQFIQGMSLLYQQGDLSNPRLINTSLGLAEGVPVLVLIYQFEIKGQPLPIPLVYKEVQGKFVFEGIQI